MTASGPVPDSVRYLVPDLFRVPTPKEAKRLRWTVLAIVAGGLAVRAVGVDADLPYTMLHFDEDYVVSDAFHFAADRTLVPNTYFYPPFYSYLVTGGLAMYYLVGRATGGFDSTDDFGWHHFLNPGRFHLVGRVVTLLFAAGGIWAVYRLGRLYRNPTVGLLAAMLLAGEVVHAERSHYALPDVPAATLTTLAAGALLAVARRRRPRDYILAGIWLGLAAATKYNAGILVAGLPIAHGAALRGSPRPWRAFFLSRGPWLCVLVTLAVFALASPTWILVLSRAIDGLLFEQANVMEGGHLGQIPDQPWIWIARQAFAGEPFLCILLGLGLVAATVRAPAGGWTLGFPLVVALATIGAWKKQSLHYLLPVLPLAAVLAADLVGALVDAVPRFLRWVPFLLAVLAVAPGVQAIVAWDLALYRKDTRVQAARWIEAEIPGGARVAVDSNLHNHLPPLRSLEHWRAYRDGNRDVPWALRERIETFDRTTPLYEIVGIREDLDEPRVPERFASTVERHPSLLRHFSRRWKTPAELASEGVEYVVASEEFRSRFTGEIPPDDSVLQQFVLGGREFYSLLDRDGSYELIRVFEASAGGIGPAIRIYRRKAAIGS